MEKIGKVVKFFERINVAVIELEKSMRLGDKIKIGNVEMTVASMQINRAPIEVAEKGQSIGLKTPKPVKEGNIVERI